ncbi:alpha/beta fold hydrolase [Rhodococcus sp. X156]|uniref:alpha/beta fold hydrolase n=1 Tax=Rhodococcus sp. X156 TaxID=2499145 RepID=UPI000FD7138E|nr:alpha/beta fold hydrolase [Rhodococcus sp. X156]
MTQLMFHDLHGDRLAYRMAGTGETLLLVHGMAGSSATWRYLIPELSKRYRVVAPDMPGHGESDKPRGDYSLGAYAATLRDLLDALDIDRVTVIGQSLGGGVALQMAYQYPERCERLVLISSGGLGREVSWTLRVLSTPGSELVLPLLAPPFVRDAGNTIRGWLGRRGLRAGAVEEMWSAYASLADGPSRRAFLRILRSVVDPGGQAVSATSRLYLSARLPMQLIWGDHDPIIPLSHGVATHEAMPSSRLAVLPGIGHFPHVEAPQEVVEIIDTFLRETKPAQPETARGEYRAPHADGVVSTR